MIISQDELDDILDKHEEYVSGGYGCKACFKDFDLQFADLSNRNLDSVDFSGANLYSANMSNSNFTLAKFYGANLSCANIMSSNFAMAFLENANLECILYNETTSFFEIQCPEKGDFVGYKICQDKIVEFLITGERNSGTTRACRCSEAKVTSITNADGSDCGINSICSSWNDGFIYEIGTTVSVENFEQNRWIHGAGIYFYITRNEAVQRLKRREKYVG